MLNRTIAPEFKQVNEINFIAPKAQQLANGIKVFTVNAGEQELVRIEFIFENVNYNQSKPLQAVTVNSLINNGTSKLSAKEIADQIDYYGAFLQTEYGADHITITLYSLSKHLSSVLPIIKAILTESTFPQQELAIFIQNQKQKLQVKFQKNDFLDRIREYNPKLFENYIKTVNQFVTATGALETKPLFELYEAYRKRMETSGRWARGVVRVTESILPSRPTHKITTFRCKYLATN